MKPLRFISIALILISVMAVLAAATTLAQAAPNGGEVTTCDDAHLTSALAGGGTVTFNCGPATLTVTSAKTLAASTTIDGSNNGQPLTLTAASGVQLFLINAGVGLTLTHLTVADLNSSFYFPIYNNGGQLNVSNSQFYNNLTGVFQSYGPMTVTQSVFSGTASQEAIYMGSSPLRVSNSQFISNTGGAISSQGPTVIDNTQFDHNLRPLNNGVIYMRYSSGGPLTVTNSSFISNTGGAIVSYGGSIYINTINFISNTVNGGGGAGLWFQNSSPADAIQILNSTFQDNNGGAISTNVTGGTLNIANTQFIDNFNGEGAVKAPYVNALTITNSSFIGNSTTSNDFPGGLLLTTPAWISGTSFINNSGPQGGAFYMSGFGKSVYMTNTQFLSNTSTTYDGGAIRDYSGNLNLSNVTVSGNRALAGYGGGLWAGDPNSAVNIDHSLFYNNIAASTNQGGAMYLYGPSSIVNSTVYSNAAYYIGGVLALRGVTLTNVTIISNTASDGLSSGNLQATGSTPGVMVNTIVAGGSPKNCSGNPTSLGYNISSDASCILTGTKDLINTNPLLGPFADNGGPTYSFMPQATSPAVNAGSNAYCPADDQRGVARPIGSTCDIGAIESPYTNTLHFVYLPLIRR